MADRIPSIKMVLLPKDTNAYGTIFGGAILSHIDLASAVEARKTATHRYVTRAMREVEFHEPVFVGDVVSFYTDRPHQGFGQNSGLGLSISKQIIEAHGGRIWAENRTGSVLDEDGNPKVLGARFIVRLPAM